MVSQAGIKTDAALLLLCDTAMQGLQYIAPPQAPLKAGNIPAAHPPTHLWPS
jgi:hypothetical protein